MTDETDAIVVDPSVDPDRRPRRRRDLFGATVATVAIATVLVTIATVVVRSAHPDTPPGDLIVAPTPWATSGASPDASLSAWPASAEPTPEPSPEGTTEPPDRRGATEAPPAGPPPVCRGAKIQAPLPPPMVTFAFDQSFPGCDAPGASTRVFLAVYTIDNGVANLNSSYTDVLSTAKPVVTFGITPPHGCDAYWIAGAGDTMIAPSFPALEPDDTHERFAGPTPYDGVPPPKVWDVLAPC